MQRLEQKELKKQRRAEIYALNRMMMVWNIRKMEQYHKEKLEQRHQNAVAISHPNSSDEGELSS